MRQQSSASSTTWTYHSSLTTAGSSAPQEPAWDSPQTRLLWTIVGMSHPRAFCLQGFPPCCKDTIYASAPPSERNWPSHLLHTRKHQNNPCIQVNNRCARILQYARRVQPGLGGLPKKQGNSQLLTSVPQSQRHGKEPCPKPSREVILWSHSAYAPTS